MSDLIIRPAAETDLFELSRLWYEKAVLQEADQRFKLLPDGRAQWTAAVRRRLHDPEVATLVAESDGFIYGYIIGACQDGPPGFSPVKLCVITDMTLDLHRYHGGVGRALVEAVRAWGAAQGAGLLVAQSLHRSAVEQAFWRSLGATEWIDVMCLK